MKPKQQSSHFPFDIIIISTDIQTSSGVKCQLQRCTINRQVNEIYTQNGIPIWSSANQNLSSNSI